MFCLHVHLFYFYFIFYFGVCLFLFFNFTVVVIKSYVSLLTLFFPPIIQDWNKNINVIYYRQHFFSCVFWIYMQSKYFRFFFQSFFIHFDPGSWFSLIIRFRYPPFLTDSRHQCNWVFVFWYLRSVTTVQFFSEHLERLP